MPLNQVNDANIQKSASRKKNVPEVPRAVFTIAEFCHAHQISQAMYFKLREAGLGPREVRAGRRVTISLEAATDWRRAREAPPVNNAA